MKIKDSNIEMSSQHRSSQFFKKTESMQVWQNKGGKIPDSIQKLSDSIMSKDKLELSKEAKDFSQKKRTALNDYVSEVNNTKATISLSEADKAKIRILEEILSSILHKRVKLISPEDINVNQSQPSIDTSFGWGLRYSKTEVYQETESMDFNSSGVIRTADGKEINFNLQLNMSRSFYEENHIEIKAGDALKDPLVVNYDGNPAQLSNKTFSFDIDCDGKKDQISSLKEGSGFLAIDLNNDGKINDGNELFGPKSGNGFQDLSKYDTDHNNWIDENDDVFNKLRIWTKDEDGNDKLFALGEKGIGAIYLGNINTQFSMKDSKNTELAEVRNSGIFLKEDGSTGTIQQIDFVV